MCVYFVRENRTTFFKKQCVIIMDKDGCLGGGASREGVG